MENPDNERPKPSNDPGSHMHCGLLDGSVSAVTGHRRDSRLGHGSGHPRAPDFDTQEHSDYSSNPCANPAVSSRGCEHDDRNLVVNKL